MKQYRGCSKFYGAEIIEAEDGSITYGKPFVVAPVKSISKTEEEASEEVWADNELQYEVNGGKTVARQFEVTNLLPEIEAKLMGQDVVTIGEGGLKGYSTPAFSNRPYFAFGYALHDGDPENPCEYVWAYRGRVQSISKASSTITKGDTTSTGRTMDINFFNSKELFEATNKRNLDMLVPVAEATGFDLTKWFEQVVTPDNASTVLKAGA
jgi:hypothetical protein